MSSVPPADAPAASDPPAADGRPTPADVLRWCAAVAPALWFPSAHARDTGVARDSLDDPLWLLRQTGLVHVADWVRGQGQGYAVTPAGEKALADPAKVNDLRPGFVHPGEDDVPPEDADLAHVPDPVAAPSPRPRNPGITAFDRGELTREAFLSHIPPVLTPVLLVANVGWFLVGLVTAWRMDVPVEQYLRGASPEVLHRIGAVSGHDLAAGEWWRLATSCFVHVGGLHLVVNMFALASIGPVAEGLWGRWRFAGLYLLAGLAGACLAVALQPAAGLAGASGAIWGVMLAVVTWLVRYREHLSGEVVAAWLRRLAVVIGINALVSLAPGISWQGHLGGAVAGFLGAIFLDLTRSGANRRQLAIGVGGVAALLAVMAGGLAAAMLYSPSWQALGRVVLVTRSVGEAEKLRQTGRPVAHVSQVKALHAAGTVALVARPPDATRKAQAAAAELKAGAARSAAGLPAGPVRDYLTEVERYAGLMGERLAGPRSPDREEWQALADQLKRVEQAWGRIEHR
jgi:membrane associated rhomboid family serine protease